MDHPTLAPSPSVADRIFTERPVLGFLVNDIVCLVMTPFALHMARRLRLPPVPYSSPWPRPRTSAVSATITGNPQNMLIGSISGITYLDFIVHLGPIAVGGPVPELGADSPALPAGSLDRVRVAEVLSAPEFQHGPMRKKPVIALGIVLGGFLVGVPPAMMAAIGAAVLLITWTVDPKRVYDEVDWGLLVFFVGLFIIVAGAERAGLTAAFSSRSHDGTCIGSRSSCR